MKTRNRRRGATLLALAALFVLLATAGVASAHPVAPFRSTGDLYVLDDGSGSVLRVVRDGTVLVSLSHREIASALGRTSYRFARGGIAVDRNEDIFFVVEGGSLLRYRDGELTVLVPPEAFTAASGLGASPAALAIGSDGRLFVEDRARAAILAVDRRTGDVAVHAERMDLLAVPGIRRIRLCGGLAAAPDGRLLVVSRGEPHAIFAVDDRGASLFWSGLRLDGYDVALARSRDGAVVLGAGGAYHRFDRDGAARLRAEDNGGLAFASDGTLVLADTVRGELVRYAPDGGREVWVRRETIAEATGKEPLLAAGIAFARKRGGGLGMLGGLGLPFLPGDGGSAIALTSVSLDPQDDEEEKMPPATPEPATIFLCAGVLILFVWTRRRLA